MSWTDSKQVTKLKSICSIDELFSPFYSITVILDILDYGRQMYAYSPFRILLLQPSSIEKVFHWASERTDSRKRRRYLCGEIINRFYFKVINWYSVKTTASYLTNRKVHRYLASMEQFGVGYFESRKNTKKLRFYWGHATSPVVAYLPESSNAIDIYPTMVQHRGDLECSVWLNMFDHLFDRLFDIEENDLLLVHYGVELIKTMMEKEPLWTMLQKIRVNDRPLIERVMDTLWHCGECVDILHIWIFADLKYNTKGIDGMLDYLMSMVDSVVTNTTTNKNSLLYVFQLFLLVLSSTPPSCSPWKSNLVPTPSIQPVDLNVNEEYPGDTEKSQIHSIATKIQLSLAIANNTKVVLFLFQWCTELSEVSNLSTIAELVACILEVVKSTANDAAFEWKPIIVPTVCQLASNLRILNAEARMQHCLHKMNTFYILQMVHPIVLMHDESIDNVIYESKLMLQIMAVFDVHASSSILHRMAAKVIRAAICRPDGTVMNHIFLKQLCQRCLLSSTVRSHTQKAEYFPYLAELALELHMICQSPNMQQQCIAQYCKLHIGWLNFLHVLLTQREMGTDWDLLDLSSNAAKHKTNRNSLQLSLHRGSHRLLASFRRHSSFSNSNKPKNAKKLCSNASLLHHGIWEIVSIQLCRSSGTLEILNNSSHHVGRYSISKWKQKNNSKGIITGMHEYISFSIGDGPFGLQLHVVFPEKSDWVCIGLSSSILREDWIQCIHHALSLRQVPDILFSKSSISVRGPYIQRLLAVLYETHSKTKTSIVPYPTTNIMSKGGPDSYASYFSPAFTMKSDISSSIPFWGSFVGAKEFTQYLSLFHATASVASAQYSATEVYFDKVLKQLYLQVDYAIELRWKKSDTLESWKCIDQLYIHDYQIIQFHRSMQPPGHAA